MYYMSELNIAINLKAAGRKCFSLKLMVAQWTNTPVVLLSRLKKHRKGSNLFWCNSVNEYKHHSHFILETSADENGYFMYSDFWCALYPGEEQLVEYLIDWYFNKEFTMQYNSTVGKWTGFTPGGLITASSWNEDQHDVLQRKLEKQLICVNNVGLALNATKENMGEYSNAA